MNKFELHLTGCDEYTFSLACFWTKMSWNIYSVTPQYGAQKCMAKLSDEGAQAMRFASMP